VPFSMYTSLVDSDDTDTLCQLGVPDLKGRKDFGSNFRQNMQLQISATIWRIEVRRNSAFYQITFVIVNIKCVVFEKHRCFIRTFAIDLCCFVWTLE